ncbi:MAG: DUF4445 domain-containing protein [Clostridia bacterium]|nr:DUF4445 domain-containing protein [Clostridia bacterium]
MKLVLKNVAKKKSVLQVISSLDVDFNAPCGGNRKCGKCLIKVLTEIEEPSKDEIKVLGKNHEKGYRLACFIKPVENMEIEIPEKVSKEKVMISADTVIKNIDPELTVYSKNIEKAHLRNQFSDIDSIKEPFNINNLELVKSVSQIIRETDYHPTVIKLNNEMVGISSQKYNDYYGIAIDIGTTTVASYLFNLKTGKRIDIVSGLNSQKKYGADVISRIEFASSDEGLAEIQKSIISQINQMIITLCTRNSIRADEIFYITVAGNTTMIHLFMKISPVNIGKAPFIPVTTALHRIKASEIGLKINENGYIAVLPSVASYIGSDITAGVLATNMLHKNKISLLLDIGTNGEIVLGNKKKMIACSTAAGPAFEGANIRFGTGGISGAIDDFKIIGNEVVFTTIDSQPPIGICGSGIITIVSQLLEHDIIDETGRFYDEDELNADEKLKERLVEFENMTAFHITDGIYITQKDIREIQNAKASFAAGVITLINRYGITNDQIDYLYLAGGFGNYIDIQSAIKIGLFPKQLKKKVIPSGNTAGTGAILCLLSSDKMRKINKISKEIEYIELSSDPTFTDQYIECMMFE